jgi:eukaryotic-like serine/threonine-protein kinase
LTAGKLTARARDLKTLEPRLVAVLEGGELPADAEEGAAFARIAFAQHKYAAAAQLWADAFSASGELAMDLSSLNRFQAARAAAFASRETVAAGGSSDDGSREHWRKQSLAWLNADLDAFATVLKAGNAQEGAAVSKRLGRWLVDPAFAGIRDETEITEAAEPERRTVREFWRRVEALHAEAITSAAESTATSKKN